MLSILLLECLCCTVRKLHMFSTLAFALLCWKKDTAWLKKVADNPEVVACRPVKVACLPLMLVISYTIEHKPEYSQGMLAHPVSPYQQTGQRRGSFSSQAINRRNFIAWWLMNQGIQYQLMVRKDQQNLFLIMDWSKEVVDIGNLNYFFANKYEITQVSMCSINVRLNTKCCFRHERKIMPLVMNPQRD